jgi:hypothetical protein
MSVFHDSLEGSNKVMYVRTSFVSDIEDIRTPTEYTKGRTASSAVTVDVFAVHGNLRAFLAVQ